MKHSPKWMLFVFLSLAIVIGIGFGWLQLSLNASDRHDRKERGEPGLSDTQDFIMATMQGAIKTPSPVPSPSSTAVVSTLIHIGALEGAAAPDFTLKALSGEEVRLKSLRGNLVLINFWTSWCPPCKDEMPVLQKAHDSLTDRGLIVLGINVTNLDRYEDVKDFSADLGLTFPILLDETGTVSNAYQVLGLPTSFFVDREGIIRKTQIGGMDETLINRILTDLQDER